MLPVSQESVEEAAGEVIRKMKRKELLEQFADSDAGKDVSRCRGMTGKVKSYCCELLRKLVARWVG